MFSASIRLDCTTSDALDSIISVASWLSVPTIPVSLFIPIGSRIGHRRARALEQRDASPASIFYLSELVDRDLCLDERRGVVVCGKRFAFAWKALTLSLRSTARSTSILAVTKVMGCVSRHGHPPLPRTRRDMAPAYHHHSIALAAPPAWPEREKSILSTSPSAAGISTHTYLYSRRPRRRAGHLQRR